MKPNLMRMFRHTSLLFILIATPLALSAQERAVDAGASQSDVPDCAESFQKAEASFRMRWRGSEIQARTESELKEVVRLCADTPVRDLAAEHLKVVQEELAETNLQTAIFYLDRFKRGGSGKSSALSRLEGIPERYPDYSKLDQVLSLLGQLKVADGNLSEAAAYYQRIVKDYPASQYAAEAIQRLSEIDVLRINTEATPSP